MQKRVHILEATTGSQLEEHINIFLMETPGKLHEVHTFPFRDFIYALIIYTPLANE